MTTDELFKKVENLKAEHSRLEGQMDSHLKQLNALGYNNLAEAEKGLADLRDSYAKLDREIVERSAELERLVNEYEAVIQ
jgi:peptidoglycan hydrolase CwlO-like protein